MTDTFSNPHRNECCSLEREIFCGHLWIILLIRWMRWQDSIPKSLSASHRDHLLPILSMNRKDCIRYSWEVFRMDRRSIKNGVISCELIDNNGQELKKCVLQYARQWQLGEEFINWVQKENIFRSSLVDRISEKRGFSDLRRTGIRRSADRCRRSLRFLGNRGSAVHQRGIPVWESRSSDSCDG